MNRYELKPTDRKSFYGKAVVEIDEINGTRTLYSYDVKIMSVDDRTGELHRFWDGFAECGFNGRTTYKWSATTGRHIAAFCGLNKASFLALPLEQ